MSTEAILLSAHEQALRFLDLQHLEKCKEWIRTACNSYKRGSANVFGTSQHLLCINHQWFSFRWEWKQTGVETTLKVLQGCWFSFITSTKNRKKGTKWWINLLLVFTMMEWLIIWKAIIILVCVPEWLRTEITYQKKLVEVWKSVPPPHFFRFCQCNVQLSPVFSMQ